MIKEIVEKIKAKISTLSEKELLMYKSIAICVLVLVVIGMVFSGINANKIKEAKKVELQEMQANDEMMKPVTVDVETLDPEMEKMVALVVPESGRANPFLPPTDSLSNSSTYGSFDLITPPEGFDEGGDAVKVVETKVSGIMYDNYNPSAILNIEGSDYLVRSGDTINSYRVLAISPSAVTVQLGSNVYKAGVGELLTGGEINYNDVPNLNKRFGGNNNRTY